MALTEHEDRRIRNTQKKLVEALIALSQEKGYDALTIREITDRADIAYSTFFRRYHDKDALLREMVMQSVETLYQLVDQFPQRMPVEEGTLVFRHVQEHETFFRVIFSGGGVNRILRQIEQETEQKVMAIYDGRADSAVPLEIVAHHIVTSILSLIRWWLEHDKPYPAERMGQIYADLIVRATEGVLASSKP